MDIGPIYPTTPAATPFADRIAALPAQSAGANARASAEPTPKVAAVQQPKPAHDAEQVAQALKSINDLLKIRSPDLEFSVDSDSDRAIVKVVDKETQEVIRQMPSEDALQIAKALDRLQNMLIREKA